MTICTMFMGNDSRHKQAKFMAVIGQRLMMRGTMCISHVAYFLGLINGDPTVVFEPNQASAFPAVSVQFIQSHEKREIAFSKNGHCKLADNSRTYIPFAEADYRWYCKKSIQLAQNQSVPSHTSTQNQEGTGVHVEGEHLACTISGKRSDKMNALTWVQEECTGEVAYGAEACNITRKFSFAAEGREQFSYKAATTFAPSYPIEPGARDTDFQSLPRLNRNGRSEHDQMKGLKASPMVQVLSSAKPYSNHPNYQIQSVSSVSSLKNELSLEEAKPPGVNQISVVQKAKEHTDLLDESLLEALSPQTQSKLAKNRSVGAGWCMQTGDTLRNTLNKWAKIAHWKVIWEAEYDYQILADGCFSGDFISAAKQLGDGYQEAEHPLKFDLYPSQQLAVISEQ